MPFFAPSAHGNEPAELTSFLEQQCAQLRTTVHGLTDEQVRATPTASGLSLAGLLAHVAQVVHGWLSGVAVAPRALAPADYVEINSRIGLDGILEAHEVPDMSVHDLLGVYDRAVDFIRDPGVQAVGLDTEVPVPPWFPAGFHADARWVWLHLSAEVARHVGHADIIRESIDGATSFDLNDAVDVGTADVKSGVRAR
ncbi:DUF664 domain-containing protein [Brevibacterium litoralis]|uniref:mycothiol transferase n=1 Tax=Brevibacterium litoralis TaxID=3138935 RepID=UPI0032F0656D